MDLLLVMFALQVLVMIMVAWFLRGALERELWAVAVEAVVHAGSGLAENQVPSVVLVVSGDVPEARMSAFAETVRRVFSPAELSVRVDPSLGGGVIVEAGALVLDHSLSGRLACLHGPGGRVACP